MLTIRFSRIGKRKKPFYRIIISEKQRDTQGKYLELLGHYNPHTKEAVFKADRIAHWLGQGAATSNSVFNLFVKHKLIQADAKRRSVSISKKRSAAIAEKKGAEAPSEPKEAPQEPQAENPAEPQQPSAEAPAAE